MVKQKLLHKTSWCKFSLRFPVCNVHAPYFHLWSAQLLNIISLYFIKGTISEKSYWI